MAGAGVAVVGLVAPLVVTASHAGADQIGSTQAQIRALEATVSSGAAAVRGLTTTYEQDNLEASTLAGEVTADRAELASLRGRVGSVTSLLRHDAVLAYTGGVTTVPGIGPGASDAAVADPSIRSVYASLASGDVGDTLDQYQVLERQTNSAEVALATQERASQAAGAAVAAARQVALDQAAAEQGRIDQLQSQLVALVSAAQAAAAARAAQAAQAARTRAASLAHPASPTTTVPVQLAAAALPSRQGLPVDGGILNVVRTVVAAPPPPPPSTVPPPPTTLPAPPPTTTPAPPTTAPPPPGGNGGAGGVWLQLRECESSDNYRANTGNGFYGAYQFSQQTWTNLGYPGRPDLEPPAMQDQAAMKLQAESGWGQWPECAAALGLT